MRILLLLSLLCLLEEGSGAFLPSRLQTYRKGAEPQQRSHAIATDQSSNRLQKGVVLQEQFNDYNDNGEWSDDGIIDPDTYLAEMELALEESKRRRVALEDELMNSMAESVLNRTPQTALAELELAKANQESVTRDLIKAMTGLLGPVGGIAGVSVAGAAAGRNVLQQRQAKIEEMERQAYQERLDAALKSEKKTVQNTVQRAAAASGIAALGVALTGTLDKVSLPSLSLPSLGSVSEPTISIKNDKQVTQKKMVEPQPELPYLEAKIKKAELEVQAKEKAVLEATQKSQRLEELLKTEAESSRSLQSKLQVAEEAAKLASSRASPAELSGKGSEDVATKIKLAELEVQAKEKAFAEANQKAQLLEQLLKTETESSRSLQSRLQVAEESAKLASARVSAAELVAKQAEARALAVERLATEPPAATVNIDKKEENTLATRKKQEAESLDLKRKVAEGMSGMRPKPTSPLSKATSVATPEISTPTASVAATALENPFDIFSKVTNNPELLSTIGGGIAAATGLAATINFFRKKDDTDTPEYKSEDGVRATMKIATAEPPTDPQKNNELPFNIPPPPKEIASPSRVSKRGDDDSKPPFASSTQDIKPQQSITGAEGAAGSKSQTPKFISSYEGLADAAAPKSSSPPFGTGAPKGSSAFGTRPGAPKGSFDASKFGASSPKGVPPFGPGAPKGSSPFQARASKFSSSPKGTPSSSKDASEDSMYFTGTSTGSPLGPGFRTGPGVPKGFSSSQKGQTSGVKGAGPDASATSGLASKGFPSPSNGFENANEGVKGDMKANSSPIAANGTTAVDSRSSPIRASPSKNASPFGASASKNASPFESSKEGELKSSPFGANTPKNASPFGSSKVGDLKSSPFGANAPNNSSPFGSSREVDSKSSRFGANASPVASSKMADPKSSPFGANMSKNASPFSKGSPKKGASFFTGASTGSPFGPGSTPKGFGSGPGAPKGFPTPVNGQKSGNSAGPSLGAPKSFTPEVTSGKVSSDGFGVAKGFPSPANGRKSDGIGFGLGAPKGFTPGSGVASSKGFGDGPGTAKGFPSPANGRKSNGIGFGLGAPKGFTPGSGVASSKSFGDGPGTAKGFPSPANKRKSDGIGPGVPKGFASGPGAVSKGFEKSNQNSAAKSAPKASSSFGIGPGAPKGFPSSTNAASAADPSVGTAVVASRDVVSSSGTLGAEATKKPAPVGSASKSYRPLSGGRTPAETNNSYSGARKREFKPFPKKGNASFDPFPDPKSVPATPGGPTFPAKKDGSKTFTSFKNGSEVTTTTPFGTGPQQSSSAGRSSFDGKKSFQPLPKTGKGLRSPFQSSEGVTRKEIKPYSGPMGKVKSGDKQSFKPYSGSKSSAGKSSSKADLPAAFKPTFPRTSIGKRDGPHSKGTGTASPSPHPTLQSTASSSDSTNGFAGGPSTGARASLGQDGNPIGGASASTSNANAQEPRAEEPPVASIDSSVSSSSYLSGMSGPVSENQGVKSSYSPYGSSMSGPVSENQGVKSSYSPYGRQKKTEPSKTSSPFGQWTPGSSNSDSSANLGAPSVPASSDKTNDSATVASAAWATKSESGDSSSAPTTVSETPKLNNDAQPSIPSTLAMGSASSSQQREQTVAKEDEKSNGAQGSSIWDSLSAAISSLSGSSSTANKQETGAVNTGESNMQRKPESYPVNSVQSSYSPFSTSQPSLGNSDTPSTDKSAAAPRNGFEVGNAVDPARNIAEPSVTPTKPVDQGATTNGRAVKTSYAPFAKKKDAPVPEKSYSPFGWTPGSSTNQASESQANVPYPPQAVASQGDTLNKASKAPANIPNQAQAVATQVSTISANGDSETSANIPKVAQATASQGGGPSGSWSPEVPVKVETTNEAGFSPFAQWLEQSAASATRLEQPAGTNMSSTTSAEDSVTKQTAGDIMAFQKIENDPVTSARQSRRRYFQPNNISAPRMGGNNVAEQTQYSNQAGTGTYGRVRDFRRADGYGYPSDRRSRYRNRAQEDIVDPTRSYSRPTDPATQGGSRVVTQEQQYLNRAPTMTSAGVPSGNWFDAGPSQQGRTTQQTDSFYYNPYGTTQNTASDQAAPSTDIGSRRGRSSYYESRLPSGNWFDDGRGGGDLLDQDWQWKTNN